MNGLLQPQVAALISISLRGFSLTAFKISTNGTFSPIHSVRSPPMRYLSPITRRDYAHSIPSGQLSPRSVCALLHVSRMAFDVPTYTLLLLLKLPRPYGQCWWRVSLRRESNDYWKEVERFSTEVAVSHKINEIALCESHALLGTGGFLRAFDITWLHNLRPLGNIL